jgi:uncharacterized protein (DUF58 family)
VAEGILSGLHRSRSLGTNIEFVEHKEYSPGDDIRHIDWRAYARRDKLSIKRFEEETNIRGTLVLDHSRSMSYRGSFLDSHEEGGMSKFQYAQILAASLAYLMLHQRDSVSLVGISNHLSHWIPSRSSLGHFHVLIQEMESMTPQYQGDFIKGLETLTEKVHQRGLVIFFSDLFEEQGRLLAALRRLRHRRHDVAVFHVLDRWEIDFPFYELTRFENLEGEDKIALDGRAIRKKYLEEFQNFLTQVRTRCLKEHIDYHLAVTDQPPDYILSKFIESRT